MFTISCPSCQRTLNLPEDAVGRPVRCPACACVFDGRSQITVIPAAPAPSTTRGLALDLTDEDDDLPFPPRRRSGLSDRGRDEETFYDPDRIRSKAHGTALLLFMALGIDVFIGILFFYQMFSGHDPGARVAGLLCVMVFFLPPVIFILIGAILLLNLRGYGMIVTGGIMAILLGVFLFLVVLFMTLAHFNAFGGPVPDTVYLETALYLGAACIHLGVGIRTLMVIHHEDVRSVFR
jgi:hypothetical protein